MSEWFSSDEEEKFHAIEIMRYMDAHPPNFDDYDNCINQIVNDLKLPRGFVEEVIRIISRIITQ